MLLFGGSVIWCLSLAFPLVVFCGVWFVVLWWRCGCLFCKVCCFWCFLALVCCFVLLVVGFVFIVFMVIWFGLQGLRLAVVDGWVGGFVCM